MQNYKKIVIKDVIPNSAAFEAEIEKGDILISINNQPIKDVLDYKFLTADELIVILIQKSSGEIWEIELEKGMDEDIGLVFDKPLMDSPKVCRNKCIFCFMDQLPPNMRSTLHFKDDDYRLSFFEGNYITLTNCDEEDIQRIINYRLSPVNISVHTTNSELRSKMLNNPNADNINIYLKRLAEAGIDINCQIVLCKGINDGTELNKTIGDLSRLYPQLKSISVVPVGLTKYRQSLYPLKRFNKEDSLEVINQIENWQKKLKIELGSNLVYAADEFYINADIEFPAYTCYEEFYQLENGVGMIALFEYEFNNYLKRLKYKLKDDRTVSIVTGTSARKHINKMVEALKKRYNNLEVYLYTIENNFFGKSITVTGLVTGSDIITQLNGKKLGDELLIPSVMLKHEEDVFLDNVTLEQVRKTLNIKVTKVENNGKDFINAVLKNHC